jgi:hypothetical protein
MSTAHVDHGHSHAHSHGSEAEAPKLVFDLSANALDISRDEHGPSVGSASRRLSGDRSEPDLSGEAV